MIHGLVLGGGALLAFSAALYCVWSLPVSNSGPSVPDRRRHLARMSTGIAVGLWLALVIGTYVSFPAYRASPPEGTTELRAYPKALIQSSPETAWLHSFGMEIKEHVPWMAAMMMTGVAFVTTRHRGALMGVMRVRGLVTAFIMISFALTAFVGLLGAMITKAAPLK